MNRFSFESQNVFQNVYANSLDAFIPEAWANESLMILENSLVIANLVHRDFSTQVQSFGDVVNTRRPATFTAARKTSTDNVTDQDATATNVAVPLDQHIHTTFVIRDEEMSKSFKDLVTEYLRPAVFSIAEMVDQVVMMQMYQHIANSAGKLGTALTKSTIVDLKELFDTNKVPMNQRNIVMPPAQWADLLNVDALTKVNEAGMSDALRSGLLGNLFGFNCFMSQIAPNVASGNTTVTGAINNASGYAVGSSTFTVDGFSAAITSGSWITIAGDMTPLRVASTVGGATPTSLVCTGYPLKSAVVDNAVVTVYTPGAINLGAGYAAGYAKSMVVDGFSVAPKMGQLISFGTASAIYGATGTPTTTGLIVNRPLDAALADNDAVGIGPAGAYGFAFHPNALALVTRPLALPRASAAEAAVINYNGLSIRVVMTYDGQAQGHRVTVDLLCGVKTLDSNLGGLLYS
jgi:hypothetical protein